MKSSPLINSFNAGQFSPLMAGRNDLKQYKNACRRIRNFIPTVQGPARRRPGTRFVAEVKNSAQRTWLGKFRFNTDQVYVLEFGNLYIRFFANDGVVGAPFEVATPYVSADLTDTDGTFRLRFVQSGDVVFMFHPRYPTQKLTRTSAVTFTVAPVSFTNGPFRDVNPSATIALVANVSGPGAGININATAPLFDAGMVGWLIRLEQRDIDRVQMWEPGKAIAINNVRRSDGKNYIAISAGNTGTIKPIHSYGQKWDGDVGILWAFQDPGYGYGIITAFVNNQNVTVTGITRFPDGATVVGFGATTRWAFGTFNAVDGYPSDGTFFRERLCMMRGRDIFGSVSGDFENMSDRDDGGIVTADMAFHVTTLSNNSDDITWIMPSNKALLFGTKADEQVVMETNTSEPFGPGNIATHKQTECGARGIAPEGVSDGVVFVQRSGRRVREMRVAESVDERWESVDLTVLSEDITRGGITQMAFQQDPDSVLWAVCADGRLIGLTISHENEVRGWHDHRIGGVVNAALGQFAQVESVVTIPGPGQLSASGGGIDHDELWMIVKRQINGVTKRYIEYLGSHHDRAFNPYDAVYVDSALTLNSYQADALTIDAGAGVVGTNTIFIRAAALWGAGDVGRYIHYYYTVQDVTGEISWARAAALITAFTNPNQILAKITEAFPINTGFVIAANLWNMSVANVVGLGHLEGQVISGTADGEVIAATVTAGTVLLSRQATKVCVGLACPAVLQPMPVEPQGNSGSTMTKKKHPTRTGLRFEEARGTKYGRDEQEILDSIPNDPDGRYMFTGDAIVPWPDGYSSQLSLTIVQDLPHPCTVIGIVPDVDVSEDR